jgi:hypothetical protein
MDITTQGITLHSEWLTILFAHKYQTHAVFKEILGQHEIHHMAIAYISHQRILTAVSSTPSIEYNLFNSGLWRYDACYQPDQLLALPFVNWQSLYAVERYHELAYIKQMQPRYSIGIAFASAVKNGHIIYSIASRRPDSGIEEHFKKHFCELRQVSEYCLARLQNLLYQHDE